MLNLEVPVHDHDKSLLDRLETLERARRGSRRRTIGAVLAVVALSPLVANALDAVPHQFADGDPIVADEMNANFTHLTLAITDLEDELATTQGNVGSIQAGLQTVRQDVGTLQQGLMAVRQDVAAVEDVPPQAVVFFNAPSCPTGWAEVPATRGRVIVGLGGSSGTLGGTVGTALGDLEDRSHTHSVNPASVATSTASGHSHQWIRNGDTSWNSAGNTTPVPIGLYNAGDIAFTRVLPDPASDYYTDAAGSHNHTVDVLATTSTGASTSDVVSYVQLLACRKTP